MLQLIEAPPRSGKTFYSVNYLCKFTKYDELYHEYILDNKVLIISNIEGLKVNHWKLDECLASRISDKDQAEKMRGVEFKQWFMTPAEKVVVLKAFFSIQNFEKIMDKTGKNHIILCIDECHDYFPAGFVDNDIYSFFAYHGHIGLDIILMCQSLVATSRMFNPLLEYIVKVTPRSRAILNNFSYSFVDIRGRFLYSRSLPKKQLVFDAYKSFRKDEQFKPKNAVKHWIVFTVCFLLISGLCFKTALALVKSKSDKAKVKPDKPVKVVSSPLPLASPVLVPFIPGASFPQRQYSTSHPPSLMYSAATSGANAVQTYGPPDFSKRVNMNQTSPGRFSSSPGVNNQYSVITVKGLVSADEHGNFHYILSDGSVIKSKKSYRLNQLFAE